MNLTINSLNSNNSKLNFFKIQQSENRRLQNKAVSFSKKYKFFLRQNNLFSVSIRQSKICLYDLIEWRILWDIHDKILEIEYQKKSNPWFFCMLKKYFSSLYIFFFNILIKFAKKKFYKGFDRNKKSKQKIKKVQKSEILAIGNNSRTIARLAKILPALGMNNLKIHSLLDQRVLFPLPLNKIHSLSYVGNWYPRLNLVKPEFKEWCRKLEKFETCNFEEKILSCVCKHNIKETFLYLYNLVLVAEQIFQKIAPKIVVNFEDTELNRVFNLLARDEKIPSVGCFFLSGIGRSRLIPRSFAQLFAAGQSIAQSLAWQYKGNTKIVGDPLVKRQWVNQKKVKSILFVATYPNYDHSEKEICSALEKTKYIADNNNLKLGIKGHPLGSGRYLAGLAKNFSIQPENCFHQEDLLEVAEKFDCFSVCVSSAVFPLLLTGKPSICCLPNKILKNYNSLGFNINEKNGFLICNKNHKNNLAKFRKYILNRQEANKKIRQLFVFSKNHIKHTDTKAIHKIVFNLKKILRK